MNRWTIGMLLLLGLLSAVGGAPPALASERDPNAHWRVIAWEDATCDGIRADDEPLLGLRAVIRHAGPNGVIDWFDPEIDISGSLPGVGMLRFYWTAPGEPYFVSIRAADRPAGMEPAPFRQGDDPLRDNDLTRPLPGFDLWATPVVIAPDVPVFTGIDLGLCRRPMGTERTWFLPLIRD